MRTVKGFAKAIKTTTFVVLLQNDLSHFERLLSIFFRCWVFETSKRYRLILQGCETISRVFAPSLKFVLTMIHELQFHYFWTLMMMYQNKSLKPLRCTLKPFYEQQKSRREQRAAGPSTTSTYFAKDHDFFSHLLLF